MKESMSTVTKIKTSIYDQLVDTGLDKLTKDKFKNWFHNNIYYDRRISVNKLYDFYYDAYDKAHRNQNTYPSNFIAYPFKSLKKRSSFRQTLENDNFRP